MMIVNDDSRVVNKLEASLTDVDRVVIYDRQMFIVQAAVHEVLEEVEDTSEMIVGIHWGIYGYRYKFTIPIHKLC